MHSGTAEVMYELSRSEHSCWEPLVVYAGEQLVFSFSTGGSTPGSCVRWSLSKAKPAGKSPDVYIGTYVQCCPVSAVKWLWLSQGYHFELYKDFA